MKIAAILVIALFVALLLAAAIAVASAPPAPQAPTADVLVVERAYTGPIERSGRLAAWEYSGGAMLVDFAPDGDGVFRNGFDLAELSSCRP